MVNENLIRNISFYVHIPYCVKRCGYCDFNTYTPQELKGDGSSGDIASVSQGYVASLAREIELAYQTLGKARVSTIFFGGGTPTLLPADELSRIIDLIAGRFELSKKCEITIEANPDSVTDDSLIRLRRAGFNRVSFGMQSSTPHVLKVLDRTHQPENVVRATHGARGAGFSHISVDLIYGTPGESLDDWRRSLHDALDLPIDHISAYALIVEKGTKLAKAVGDGTIKIPEDDETAEKYRIADDIFSERGYSWYELSNWAKPGGECRHNIAYWKNEEWWGLGPGAHSHINGTRWWNVKHPATYMSRLRAKESPVLDREELTTENALVEKMMLGIRMRDGISRKALTATQCEIVERYKSTHHIDEKEWENDQLVLSQSGRLIADRIVRELLV